MNRIPRYKTHLALAVTIVVLSLMSVFTQSAQASTAMAGPGRLLQASSGSSDEGEGFVVGFAIGLALVGGATVLIRTRGR